MEHKLYCKFIWNLAKIVFPKPKIVYKTEPEKDEPAIYVANHSAAIGPAMMTLYFEKPHKTWMIAYPLDKEKGANFAFHDIFFGRAKKNKCFWRVLSKIVAKMLRPVLAYGNPIPVYHDKRMINTFRESLDALNDGQNLVIFPESPERYSQYVCSFYEGFVDLGRTYYTTTGKNLKFYPCYIEKKNKVISVGEPVVYDHSKPTRLLREEISVALRNAVDELARELPEHKPVPFLPEVWYEFYGEYEHNPTEYWRMIE